MTIEIANETDGVVHVAIYKRSPLRPAEPAVAWTIVSPPPQGRAIFSIPSDYRVFARYSFSSNDPWQPVYQTNALSLHRDKGSLSLREISLGRSAWGAILARNAREAGLGAGELRIKNDFSTGVWCHVQLGERDVHSPRFLFPQGALIESLSSPFLLAVVNPLVREGVFLIDETIRATEIELEAGEGRVFSIHGATTQGYRITRGAPAFAERVMQPKEADVPPRVKSKKERRAPEKKSKAQARAKADIKKQEAAKRPASRQRGREKTKLNSSQV